MYVYRVCFGERITPYDIFILFQIKSIVTLQATKK